MFGLTYEHEKLARETFWRCIVRGLGFGRVTGRIRLGTLTTSYEIELDSGRRAYHAPSDVQPVPAAPVIARARVDEAVR